MPVGRADVEDTHGKAGHDGALLFPLDSLTCAATSWTEAWVGGANRNDSVMLAPTLDGAKATGLLQEIETIWFDRGYDSEATRERLKERGVDDAVIASHRQPFVHHDGSGYTLYMFSSAALPVSEARQQLAEIIDRARAEHTPIYLARRGRRVAAVIDADDLDAILELAEDMADIRAAEVARAEMRTTGETPIPWEQVKADLGLV
ncbi:MAG: type II toxin-antitoxin system Phd/YefM family antitoxin [Acidimicrobiales bacterium]